PALPAVPPPRARGPDARLAAAAAGRDGRGSGTPLDRRGARPPGPRARARAALVRARLGDDVPDLGPRPAPRIGARAGALGRGGRTRGLRRRLRLPLRLPGGLPLVVRRAAQPAGRRRDRADGPGPEPAGPDARRRLAGQAAPARARSAERR